MTVLLLPTIPSLRDVGGVVLQEVVVGVLIGRCGCGFAEYCGCFCSTSWVCLQDVVSVLIGRCGCVFAGCCSGCVTGTLWACWQDVVEGLLAESCGF